MVAAALHGGGQLVCPAEGADEQRHQDGEQGLGPAGKTARLKIGAPGLLGTHDLVRLLDERGDEPEGDAHHHGQLMDGEAQLFQRRHQPLQPVGELKGGGGIGQQERAAHQQHDPQHHQHRPAQALLRDAEDPPLGDHPPGEVEEVQKGREGDDENQWLGYLNRYLEKFHCAPIKLKDGKGSLFDRFYCDVQPGIHDGPLITVIMPAFNAERSVEMAARSILDQTWKNIELVIIDDASSDGTWEKLQMIAHQDDRVRVLRNSVNVGPYVTKNIGLMIANGDFLTGHDADDWAHPERLYKQMLVFKEHPNAYATIGWMLRSEKTGKFNTFAKESIFCLDGAARRASISCMFRKKIFAEMLGYWDNVRFGADSEMIDRAQKVFGEHFVVSNDITMICLDLPESLTNSSDFGINKTGGLSPVRAEYKAAWTKWHENIVEGEPRRLDLHSSRPYVVPDRADVQQEQINCLIEQYSKEEVL